ncbi:MAG: phosphate acetyltransferase [Lacipirellulaceae bacterium]
MSQGVYVAAWEPRSGKSVVVLGLMELLSRRVERLAYFRPLYDEPSGPGDDPQPTLRLVAERYRMPWSRERLVGVSSAEARRLAAEGREDELVKRVLDAYRGLAAEADFVVVEGTDYTGAGAALEFDFNARLAANLGCPTLAVGNAHGKTIDATLEGVRAAEGALVEHGASIVATIVNRVDPDSIPELLARLGNGGNAPPYYALPEEPLLARPTVGEIAHGVGAHWLHETPDAAERDVSAFKVAAMQLPNFLDRLVDNSLVITPGDRADVILAAVATIVSNGFPKVAGLLLTGGFGPPDRVRQLLEGMERYLPPIFAVEADTFTAATSVANVKGSITADNKRKIAVALGLFERHVDLARLGERLAVARSERVTPLMFEYDLIERAKSYGKRIVLPEGTDDRVLRAAEVLSRRQVAELTILGDPKALAARAAALGLSLDLVPEGKIVATESSAVRVIDPATSPLRAQLAEALYEARKHKGMTRDTARDLSGDVSYFGVLMVHTGLADGMVSGAAHTTAATVRPALEVIRAEPGVATVSSVFLMCLPDKVLVYGDCAVNTNPTTEQLADIAVSSADTARRFGIEPRVALLSYSTGESGAGEDVDRVRNAARIAKQRRPDLLIEGPLQYDAAVDPDVARSKAPGSAVAGRATVLIFPDLDSGNNTYKAVQRSAGAVAVGPVLQGLRKPVNDLSRGCTVADIVNTVAITAIQAGE